LNAKRSCADSRQGQSITSYFGIAGSSIRRGRIDADSTFPLVKSAKPTKSKYERVGCWFEPLMSTMQTGAIALPNAWLISAVPTPKLISALPWFPQRPGSVAVPIEHFHPNRFEFAAFEKEIDHGQ
jgi:hypothetical protein